MIAAVFTFSNLAFAVVAVRLAMVYEQHGQTRMAWVSSILAGILTALATWAACDLITGLSM